MTCFRMLLLASLAVVSVFVLACGGDDGASAGKSPTPAVTVVQSALSPAAGISASATAPAAAAFALTSEAFANGASIPTEYSCDGKSSSPPLKWSGAPSAAKAFALVMHDPDAPRAGGFTHWVVYDLPAGTTGLDGGASPSGSLPAGAKQGANGSGRNQYTGPCPPKGGPAHHYNFRLYALDAPLNLEAGKTKEEIEKAVQGHVLAQADLTGLFAH